MENKNLQEVEKTLSPDTDNPTTGTDNPTTGGGGSGGQGGDGKN
jgi:hypothetical protein